MRLGTFTAKLTRIFRLHGCSIAKSLGVDHVPINFHPWALAILEHFDLERYHAAYHLPRDEYEAIARDLPVVLEGLRNYPVEKLAAPIDEDNWGYIDY